eukprot:UN09194
MTCSYGGLDMCYTTPKHEFLFFFCNLKNLKKHEFHFFASLKKPHKNMNFLLCKLKNLKNT